MAEIEKKNEEVKLKRVLSLPYLVAFGLAYLAPTVVFNYYGIITQMTGGMMALAYIITTVVMFFTAYSYTHMVKAFPIAGSAYTYVQRSVNPHVGFMTGWVLLLDYFLLPLICYLLFGIYMNEFVPQVSTTAWILIILVFSTLINIVGVQTAGVVNTIIITCQILFTIAFVVLCIRYVVTGGPDAGDSLFSVKNLFNADTFSFKDLFAGSSILAVSFLGFDAVSTMAEETKNPGKTISKAVMIIAVGAGIVFAIVAYFSQAAWPTAYEGIEDPDAGIFELLPKIGGAVLPTIFLITDNLATFICAMAGVAAVSRILFGMGREGALPKAFFGKLSKRFNTPIYNILLTSFIALGALFFRDNLVGAASFVSFGALTGFVFVNYSVFSLYFIRRKLRKGFANILKYVIMPWIGVIVCVWLWIMVDTNAKIAGFIWLGVGLIYLAISTKGFKTKPKEFTIEE